MCCAGLPKKWFMFLVVSRPMHCQQTTVDKIDKVLSIRCMYRVNQLDEINFRVFDYTQSRNVFIFRVFDYTHSQMFARETTRQNAYTTSTYSEHQVSVICEGKNWNVRHRECCIVLMRWACAKGRL
jgi:hypothetical protein